jgi:hypothetical protein
MVLVAVVEVKRLPLVVGVDLVKKPAGFVVSSIRTKMPYACPEKSRHVRIAKIQTEKPPPVERRVSTIFVPVEAGAQFTDPD